MLRLFNREAFLTPVGETPSNELLTEALLSVPVQGDTWWTSVLQNLERLRKVQEPNIQGLAESCKVLWIGDSGSKVYNRTAGKKSKSREPKTEISAAFPRVDLTMQGISGATPADLAEQIVRVSSTSGRWDVAVLSTFLNGVDGKKWKGEPLGLEGDFRRIGEVMRRFKRPLVIVGGSADVWHYDMAWDVTVEKMRGILGEMGIPSITGVTYLKEMTMGADGVHAATGDDTTSAWQRQFGDIVHGLYALCPIETAVFKVWAPSFFAPLLTPGKGHGVVAETPTPVQGPKGH